MTQKVTNGIISINANWASMPRPPHAPPDLTLPQTYDRFRLFLEVSIDQFVVEFVNRTYNLRFGTQVFPEPALYVFQIPNETNQSLGMIGIILG